MHRDRNEETGTRARVSMVSAVLGLSVLTAACNVETNWQEEVKLSDERVIVLDRRILSVRSGFPNSSRGPVLEEEVEYKPMGARWQLERGLKHIVQPEAFDIIDGVPFLAAATSDKSVCARHGEGGYMTKYFRWEVGSGWVEVSQREVPIDRIRRNLLSGTRSAEPKDDPQGLVTLKQKGLWDRSEHNEPLKTFYDRLGDVRCAATQ